MYNSIASLLFFFRVLWGKFFLTIFLKKIKPSFSPEGEEEKKQEYEKHPKLEGLQRMMMMMMMMIMAMAMVMEGNPERRK